MVGFRKDREAWGVYQKTKIVNHYNQEIPIKLTEVFEMLVEAKGWQGVSQGREKRDSIIERKSS